MKALQGNPRVHVVELYDEAAWQRLAAALNALVDAGAHELPVSRADYELLRAKASDTRVGRVLPSGGLKTWFGVPLVVLAQPVQVQVDGAAVAQALAGLASSTAFTLNGFSRNDWRKLAGLPPLPPEPDTVED